MSPSNQTRNLSSDSYNVTLRCEANGTLSYIWDRQNGGIPSGSIGKNTNTLTLIDVQPEDSGNYRCVATNRYGSKMSDYTKITINGMLSFIWQGHAEGVSRGFGKSPSDFTIYSKTL